MRQPIKFSIFVALFTVACATAQTTPRLSDDEINQAPSRLMSAALNAALHSKAESLPFIEDDWPAALALAKEENKPIFVDTWAPWCPACVIMNTQVFNDPALAKHAERFVWLKIDTEKSHNLAFVTKFPNESWPTFYVIDPVTETAVFKWVDGTTVEGLAKLFDDAEQALTCKGTDAHEAALAQADRLNGAGKAPEAAQAYTQLLKSAPLGWTRRGRVAWSLMLVFYGQKNNEACAKAAAEFLPGAARDHFFAKATSLGLSQAVKVKATDLTAQLEPLAREALNISGLSAEVHSDLYYALADVLAARGDTDAAKQLFLNNLRFLESERKKATSAEARAAFDPLIVSVAREAGVPERALPYLEESERALPADYNPARRQATILKNLKRYPEALAACERAYQKAYGPPQVWLLETKAQILEAMGDGPGRRQALETALVLARLYPDKKRFKEKIPKIEAELKK